MIFVGALIKLLGRGRVSAAGAALAGFALVLFGLTTLQQGMGGLAERLHPADLPAVLGAPGVGWWSGSLAVLVLIGVGLLMTAVMQSSTAAIAVTLSAHYAGAVGLDQACALIIGQNIGTATRSAMGAIGASSTAKRLALAYILFKLVAAVIVNQHRNGTPDLHSKRTPLLIELAHEREEQLPASLSEGQIAKFVENGEVLAGEIIGDPSRSRTRVSLTVVLSKSKSSMSLARGSLAMVI
jgi:hypothetical protein